MMGLTEAQNKEMEVCERFGMTNLWHLVMLYRHYKPILEDALKDFEKYEKYWRNFMSEVSQEKVESVVPTTLIQLGFDAVALYTIYTWVKPYEQTLMARGQDLWSVVKSIYIHLHGEPTKP